MPFIHLPLDKMATILLDDTLKCIFFNENDRILNRISLLSQVSIYIYRKQDRNELEKSYLGSKW